MLSVSRSRSRSWPCCAAVAVAAARRLAVAAAAGALLAGLSAAQVHAEAAPVAAEGAGSDATPAAAEPDATPAAAEPDATPAAAEPDAAPAVPAEAARPIAQAPPEYPAAARKKGQEGWVIVSYVVLKDGSVGEVLVEDSSGEPAFEAAVTEAVSAWRYEPARLNGEPTEEAHAGVVFPFSIDARRGGRGASASFTKKYRRVMSKREKGELEEAARMTHELAAEPDLNLYEAASAEILLSLLSRDADDARAELRHLQRANVNLGQFLDEGAQESLLFRMFALQVELSDYAQALATYDDLARVRGRSRMPEPVENVANEIRALVSSDRDFAVPAVLGEADPSLGGRGRFDHLLLRRIVGFTSDTMQDDLDEYELRCDFNRVKGEPHANRAIRIPEAWGSCRVYVYGRPGSEFRIVEYADPSS